MINFMGTDGFTWFQGKVESNQDPENIGRCKVRCIGFYSDKIKTADLPWAHPVTPLNTRGLFATPNVGDWVFGFFRDGDAASEPMMLGILPGRNTVNKAKAYTHDNSANQLVTNSGHKIDLNDGTNEISITHNNTESLITFKEDKSISVKSGQSEFTIHGDGKLSVKNDKTNLAENLKEIVTILTNLSNQVNWTGNMGAPLIYAQMAADKSAITKIEKNLGNLLKDY